MSAATEQTAYLDNRDYALAGGSVTKARLFETACQGLLLLRPEEMEHGDTRISEGANLKSIQSELDRVRKWLDVHDSAATSTKPSSHVVHADFRGYR